MLWHKPNRRSVLAGALALGGCGFVPVYGTNGTANALNGAIRFQTPLTVAGSRLRSQLEDRLGATTAPQFTLTVTLDIQRDSVAITEDGDITRFTLPGIAIFALRSDAGDTVAQGTVSSFTSYSATGTTVATQVAEEDAEARLAVILADRIVTRLLATTP